MHLVPSSKTICHYLILACASAPVGKVSQAMAVQFADLALFVAHQISQHLSFYLASQTLSQNFDYDEIQLLVDYLFLLYQSVDSLFLHQCNQMTDRLVSAMNLCFSTNRAILWFQLAYFYWEGHKLGQTFSKPSIVISHFLPEVSQLKGC